jgi:hypothetical protein
MRLDFGVGFGALDSCDTVSHPPHLGNPIHPPYPAVDVFASAFCGQFVWTFRYMNLVFVGRRATFGRDYAEWGAILKVRNDRTLTSHMRFPLPLLLPVDGRDEGRPTVMTNCANIPKCPQ